MKEFHVILERCSTCCLHAGNQKTNRPDAYIERCCESRTPPLQRIFSECTASSAGIYVERGVVLSRLSVWDQPNPLSNVRTSKNGVCGTVCGFTIIHTQRGECQCVKAEKRMDG